MKTPVRTEITPDPKDVLLVVRELTKKRGYLVIGCPSGKGYKLGDETHYFWQFRFSSRFVVTKRTTLVDAKAQMEDMIILRPEWPALRLRKFHIPKTHYFRIVPQIYL